MPSFDYNKMKLLSKKNHMNNYVMPLYAISMNKNIPMNEYEKELFKNVYHGGSSLDKIYDIFEKQAVILDEEQKNIDKEFIQYLKAEISIMDAFKYKKISENDLSKMVEIKQKIHETGISNPDYMATLFLAANNSDELDLINHKLKASETYPFFDKNLINITDTEGKGFIDHDSLFFNMLSSKTIFSNADSFIKLSEHYDEIKNKKRLEYIAVNPKNNKNLNHNKLSSQLIHSITDLQNNVFSLTSEFMYRKNENIDNKKKLDMINELTKMNELLLVNIDSLNKKFVLPKNTMTVLDKITNYIDERITSSSIKIKSDIEKENKVLKDRKIKIA